MTDMTKLKKLVEYMKEAGITSLQCTIYQLGDVNIQITPDAVVDDALRFPTENTKTKEETEQDYRDMLFASAS